MAKLTTVFLFLFALLVQATAQPEEIALDSALYENRAAVTLKKDTLFILYDQINGISPAERASLVELRLQNLVRTTDFQVDSFNVQDNEGYSSVLYKDRLIVNITSADAQWYGVDPQQVARDVMEVMKEHGRQVRSDLDLQEILKQVSLAVLVLVISAFVIKYVNRLFRFLAVRLRGLRGTYITGFKIRSYEVLNEERLVSFLLLALNVLRIFFLIFIFYLTLPLVLNIFPWTEPIADMLFGFILNPLRAIIHGIVAYIPNLFTILIIFLVVRYIARGIRYLADEVKTEKLQITGFYSDWAVPTARILIFLLYAFMLVVVWPYLPGSDSNIFKGVSVFLGLLLTLGSSSAVANLMAGLVVTYMRPYQVGHRVKIGEVSGDVVEKNLLVTRVRTIKNEIITVPNNNILNNSSINYSLSSEKSEGLVVHTSVTIGYDVPWRQVHQMLIEAAKKTPLVERHPEPFVLQTSLDDFYVSYQVNAYTRSPDRQSIIYSDLHSLIQDIFARNDVEIMSPHYRANREGPNTTPTTKPQ